MSVRRSVIWSFTGQGLSSIIAFGTSVVLAHVLTPGEFGIYAIALAAQGILQVFATFSVGAYVIRQDIVDEHILASAFTINALISLALAGAVTLLSFAATPLLGVAAAGGVLRLLALGPVLGILTFRPAAMLQRAMAFKTISIISFVNTLMTSAVTLSAAALGATYRSAAWGLVASSAYQALAYSVIGRRYVGLRIGFTQSRDIIKFGLNIVSVSGVALMMTRLSELALARVLGPASLGLYGRASGIANMLVETVYATATKISYVKLSQDARDNGDLRPTFLRSMQLITGLMWPMQIGLAVLSGPIISGIYGSRWLAAALPLSLLMVGQCLSLTIGMNWELFALRHEMFRQTRLETTRAGFGFLVFLAATPFGLSFVAASRIVEALFGLLIYRRHIPRLGGLRPGELARDWTQSAIMAAAAVSPAVALMTAVGWSSDVPYAWIGISIGFGTTIWLIAAAAFNHSIWREVRMLLGSVVAARQ